MDMLYKGFVLAGKGVGIVLPYLLITAIKIGCLREEGESCIYLRQKMGISGFALPAELRKRP